MFRARSCPSTRPSSTRPGVPHSHAATPEFQKEVDAAFAAFRTHSARSTTYLAQHPRALNLNEYDAHPARAAPQRRATRPSEGADAARCRPTTGGAAPRQTDQIRRCARTTSMRLQQGWYYHEGTDRHEEPLDLMYEYRRMPLPCAETCREGVMKCKVELCHAATGAPVQPGRNGRRQPAAAAGAAQQRVLTLRCRGRACGTACCGLTRSTLRAARHDDVHLKPPSTAGASPRRLPRPSAARRRAPLGSRPGSVQPDGRRVRLPRHRNRQDALGPRAQRPRDLVPVPRHQQPPHAAQAMKYQAPPRPTATSGPQKEWGSERRRVGERDASKHSVRVRGGIAATSDTRIEYTRSPPLPLHS